jgi:2-C-methyl-D-erythritol 4-phosphate cytidylyltransferase
MGAGKNKLLLELNSIPVFIHSLKVFEEDELCDGIILAIHPQDEAEFNSLLKKYGVKKVLELVPGGKERQDSIYNALKTVKGDGIILVHDAARPFIRKEHIHGLLDTALETGAAIIGVQAKDTMKTVRDDVVMATVERSSLWAVQTPQAFRFSVLYRAYEQAEKDGFIGTDDSSLVERISHPVTMVEGDYDNIKLTTQEDLFFAQAILQKRQGSF